MKLRCGRCLQVLSRHVESAFFQVYKQKVKHLFYEHQNNITQLKTEDEETLKLAHDDNRTKEQGMRKQTRKTKGEMKELEIAHEDVVKNLKQARLRSLTAPLSVS